MAANYSLPMRLADSAMRQAAADLRADHEAGRFHEGDPNSPAYNNGHNYTRPLFGHATGDFLRKQYARAGGA